MFLNPFTSFGRAKVSISKSAFSLSKDEYEGTGKRLFIGLVIGTAILLCVLLLLIWLVPTIGFAAIHPWLPFIAGIVFGGAILGILWLSVGLVLHAYTGKPILGIAPARHHYPPAPADHGAHGPDDAHPVAAVRRSFIKVNNELVLSSGIQCEPRQLLVLLPHCIQSSRCTHRLTYHIDNCARCGPARSRTYSTCGTPTACRSPSPPGNHRPPHRRAGPPQAHRSRGLERDLSSGIQDTHPCRSSASSTNGPTAPASTPSSASGGSNPPSGISSAYSRMAYASGGGDTLFAAKEVLQVPESRRHFIDFRYHL